MSQNSSFELHDITFSASAGELIMIIGSIASGKVQKNIIITMIESTYLSICLFLDFVVDDFTW